VDGAALEAGDHVDRHSRPRRRGGFSASALADVPGCLVGTLSNGYGDARGDLRRRSDRRLRAYFLSLRQVEVMVVERTGVACAAWGKAGGFLALDWCDGSPLTAGGGLFARLGLPAAWLTGSMVATVVVACARLPGWPAGASARRVWRPI
jgi:hypothetical protein